MELPAILKGDSVKRLLQGAALGAIATMIIGFNWGGWVTGGTAADNTQKSTRAAVVSALSPICVDKFQHSADAVSNLVELKKVSSYQQGSFVEKGGWATLPGSDKSNSAVAEACANMLNSLKQLGREGAAPAASFCGPAWHDLDGIAMMFPNHSRSYDATRRAVRFWGYDASMEWSFFVTEDALKHMSPAMEPAEAAMLRVFDSNRESIVAAAERLFRRGRKGSYELGVADLQRMLTRTRVDIVTFAKPFSLKGVERTLPAGDYRVSTDEELIEGLSFPVYRRVATMIFVPAQPNGAAMEMFTIDPAELRAAQKQDCAPDSKSAELM